VTQINQPPLACQITLHGRLQGLGVRPAIVRWAAACGVTGWVSNDYDGVLIHLEGDSDGRQRFLDDLGDHLPDRARLDHLVTTHVPVHGYDSFFVYRASKGDNSLATVVPPDVVTCETCLTEVLDGSMPRRQGYAFTSCADCGPRYSMLHSMPYDRDGTEMCPFLLCQDCRQEYEDPNDRRFHAQSMACRQCGPRLTWKERYGATLAEHDQALSEACAAILRGDIIAVLGIGGYQLVCDATSESSVRRIRERKGRATKPLAVMVQDLESARDLVQITELERDVLSGPAGPIVLCRARTKSGLTPSVHPGLTEVGLMLPTTPLHALLSRATHRPLVVTSANREGDPLLFDSWSDNPELGQLADWRLDHFRRITNPIDDSVVRCSAGRAITLRLGRGLAPLPLDVDIPEALLAVGGHQKVALALSNGRQTILGPHFGDLDSLTARQRFDAYVGSFLRLFRKRPEAIAHDLHPDYATTRWVQSREVPTVAVAVQHHHAHVVSGMIEHGWLDREVLGVAFDGTGFGADGSIWGGEFLRSTVRGFERVGHLRPFRLPGGERSVREPYRIALALAHEAGCGRAAAARFDHAEAWPQMRDLLERPHLHPLTTSAGRLFDSLAALILGQMYATYEGEPAMILEAAADTSELNAYPMPILKNRLPQLDWRPTIAAVLADLDACTPPGVMAMRFHRGLARGIATLVRQLPPLPVVLTGGCFQNRLLTESVRDELGSHPQPLGLPGVIPSNDGGLAAGQLVIAAARRGSLRLGGTSPCA
jgi:hydrogenase maturation protein HypF